MRILLVKTDTVACIYSPIQNESNAWSTVPESKSKESNITPMIKKSRGLIIDSPFINRHILMVIEYVI